jgi:hypothetical protein
MRGLRKVHFVRTLIKNHIFWIYFYILDIIYNLCDLCGYQHDFHKTNIYHSNCSNMQLELTQLSNI